MSDKPIFIYAATYADEAGAEADYETLLELHKAKLVGTYDVALVTKDADGKVHVDKHEKPTQHAPGAALPLEQRSGFSPRPQSYPRRWSAASSEASAGTSEKASQEATPRNSAT